MENKSAVYIQSKLNVSIEKKIIFANRNLNYNVSLYSFNEKNGEGIKMKSELNKSKKNEPWQQELSDP